MLYAKEDLVLETMLYHEINPAPLCSVRDCPLAMAYVPMQRWRALCAPEDGFPHGTIFEELDKPFLGKAGCRE